MCIHIRFRYQHWVLTPYMCAHAGESKCERASHSQRQTEGTCDKVKKNGDKMKISVSKPPPSRLTTY